MMEALLAGGAGLSVSDGIRWRRKAASYEFSLNVRNNLGRRLVLFGQQCDKKLHAATFALHCTESTVGNLFRLCVRGRHTNRRSDGVQHHGTHLHRWTSEHRDEQAVAPFDPPWPPSPWQDDSQAPLSDDHLRLLFQQFCQMMHVTCDPDEIWRPKPSIEIPEFLKLPDGEEIP
ncbi:hypothetical protein ACIQTZ_00510 [Paenarthrobacter sp. NPDC090520]|uniref:hypothetical protein n=1 Tax=Paenarthrobacter sp. NPDC090520 TaxID=3364382 RepID=UPI0037FB6830